MSRTPQYRLKVAIGLIFNATGQQIFVALRPSHYLLGGLWEFPGGKFENNETPFEALKRELLEEIGIDLLEAKALLNIEHDYSDTRVELNVLQVTNYTGNPFGREGQEVRWVDIEELSALPFPEGNRLIIEKIKTILIKA